MEAVGRLAGGVAHDFNNLLTVIASGTELLLQSLRDPAEREYAEMIRQAGERGAGLTRQLLAFSRRQVLRPEVLDLNALLTDLQRLLRRLIGEDIEQVTDLSPEAGRVRADRTQLEQVVMNLAVNARDAMPQGGRLTLRTHNANVSDQTTPLPRARGWVPPGDYTVLEVRDTGLGMTEEVKAHLFEPFFTTKEQGKGTGLGLATVYGVVRQTGGHIVVESEPGQGTAFRIYLPRTDLPTASAAPAREAGALQARQETVLLVEDEEAVRAMVRRILQAKGYTVLEACDGEEALQVSTRFAGGIDLMLTDVVMPRTDGLQLAGRLRELRPATRVLYMSGYPDDALVRQAVTASGKAFLQKPFSPGALAERVREVLDG
jgi:CheY-like chemotaxis protein